LVAAPFLFFPSVFSFFFCSGHLGSPADTGVAPRIPLASLRNEPCARRASAPLPSRPVLTNWSQLCLLFSSPIIVFHAAPLSYVELITLILHSSPCSITVLNHPSAPPFHSFFLVVPLWISSPPPCFYKCGRQI